VKPAPPDQTASPISGHRSGPASWPPYRAFIEELVWQDPDITLFELRALAEAEGVEVHQASIIKLLIRLGFTYEKTYGPPFCKRVKKLASDGSAQTFPISGRNRDQDRTPRGQVLIKDAASLGGFFEPGVPTAGRLSGHLPHLPAESLETRGGAAPSLNHAHVLE
jgi:hypothetical protein